MRDVVTKKRRLSLAGRKPRLSPGSWYVQFAAHCRVLFCCGEERTDFTHLFQDCFSGPGTIYTIAPGRMTQPWRISANGPPESTIIIEPQKNDAQQPMFIFYGIQSSTAITRSIIVRYYINNYRNWGKIFIRCWIHNGRVFSMTAL